MNPTEQLKELYYSPKIGFKGALGLYKAAQKANIKVSFREVTSFLSKQESYQLQKEVKRPINYPPVRSKGLFKTLECDLLDMRNYDTKQNKGMKYLLVVIDVESRFAWMVALHDKTESVVTSAMKKVLSSIPKGKLPETIDLNSDRGSEFTSKSFKDLLEHYNVTHYLSAQGDIQKTPIVDRFHGVIRTTLGRMLDASGNQAWYPLLDDLAENLNSRHHRTIDAAPIDVLRGKAKPRKDDRQFAKANADLHKLNVGDKVRFLIMRKDLDAKKIRNFSKSVHTIESISGYRVKLSDIKQPVMYYNVQVVEEVQTKPNVVEEIAPEKVDQEAAKNRLMRRQTKVLKEIAPHLQDPPQQRLRKHTVIEM